MLRAGDVVEHDNKLVKELSLKLINSDFREKTTHEIAKIINRMKFDNDSVQYHHYNCVRLIKLMNQEICDYYDKKYDDPEKVINHECLVYIKLLNSLINKFHSV